MRYPPNHFAREALATLKDALTHTSNREQALPGPVYEFITIWREERVAALAFLLVLVIEKRFTRTRIKDDDPSARGLGCQSGPVR